MTSFSKSLVKVSSMISPWKWVPKNSIIQWLGYETGSETTFCPHMPALAKWAVFGKKHNVSVPECAYLQKLQGNYIYQSVWNT